MPHNTPCTHLHTSKLNTQQTTNNTEYVARKAKKQSCIRVTTAHTHTGNVRHDVERYTAPRLPAPSLKRRSSASANTKKFRMYVNKRRFTDSFASFLYSIPQPRSLHYYKPIRIIKLSYVTSLIITTITPLIPTSCKKKIAKKFQYMQIYYFQSFLLLIVKCIRKKVMLRKK